MFKNTELEARFGFEALPTIQDGKLAAIYPLNIIHPGDSPRIFSGKYVGEINHIYELLTKIVTNQTIDENNPMPYEFKFENNQIYVRDKDNSKWTLIGDVTKLYFGAKDYADENFIKSLSVNNATVIYEKGNGLSNSITIDNVNHADNALKDNLNQRIDTTYIKSLSVNNAKIIYERGDNSSDSFIVNNVGHADEADISRYSIKAEQDKLGQKIDNTYIKSLSAYGGILTAYRGDNGTSVVEINNVVLAQNALKAEQDKLGQQIDTTYVKDVLESNGIVTVSKGNQQSEVLCFTAISGDTINDILKLNEDTQMEEKEAIVDETIVDIIINKGEGYITVYSLNSAIDTETIDNVYTNSDKYPEPAGDECISSSEIDDILTNGGMVA